MKETNYTIHFGETASFKVNEWLYNYFNSVKDNREEYNKLYNILIGVKYQIVERSTEMPNKVFISPLSYK